jgi:general secretion pathway protein H
MELVVGKGMTRTSFGSERGFSLIELVVVLAIVSLAATLVMPSLDKSFEALQIRRTALNIAAVARSLRTRSMKEQIPFRLVVNAAEGSYEVLGQDPVLLPEGMHLSVAGGAPVGEGVTHFIFFPNGRLVGGEILLSNQRDSGYTVRLDTVSAKVKVSRSKRS